MLLLGGRTGRDGCGEATGSSRAHTARSLELCGAEVQKGNDPALQIEAGHAASGPDRPLAKIRGCRAERRIQVLPAQLGLAGVVQIGVVALEHDGVDAQ